MSLPGNDAPSFKFQTVHTLKHHNPPWQLRTTWDIRDDYITFLSYRDFET